MVGNLQSMGLDEIVFSLLFFQSLRILHFLEIPRFFNAPFHSTSRIVANVPPSFSPNLFRILLLTSPPFTTVDGVLHVNADLICRGYFIFSDNATLHRDPGRMFP